ncbi:hypothetical protein [[Clostridium] innocuum]|uniref:hypothetical protein n=1 Tax=Clostridium innocuum TaxID=1522 RepID=UPI001AFB0869|nr:hypothetical protein [[Clostridium] innocuum]QSI27787.1 hypothetical protein GKZ87_20910 [Erysipelotrichaceae bacterium 66202529]DAU14222.1 MAG TPA: hypothetical protein [Caudoviricetes sp.]MCC2832105.1 hypothetical protein [[Clostridium] innocuum]MCR0247031.1 hypothetical protein [[Clostridium] innocuum]MCR0258393.1 hypothetical protein [[Clostridium] innocuum]
MSEITEIDLLSENCELKRNIIELKEENEKLKRQIFGLETTISNYKQKDYARYKDMGWSK